MKIDLADQGVKGVAIRTLPFRRFGPYAAFEGHAGSPGEDRDGSGILQRLIALRSGTLDDAFEFIEDYGPPTYGTPKRAEWMRDNATDAERAQLDAAEAHRSEVIDSGFLDSWTPLVACASDLLELAVFLNSLLHAMAAPEKIPPPPFENWRRRTFIGEPHWELEYPIPTLLLESHDGPRIIQEHDETVGDTFSAIASDKEGALQHLAVQTVRRMWNCEPRPTLSCGGKTGFEVRIEPGSVVAIAGQQLAAMLSNTRRPATICSSCRGAFFPDRRPRKDQRSFCPTCHDHGAPGRFAQADYRSRQRDKS